MLVSGLLAETPLGKIISIRAESNKDVLKTFSPDMLKIKNDWKNKKANNMLKDESALDNTFKVMEKTFEILFS